ncbi:hypothetical protein ACFY9F_32665 [Streptomyces sp. NPDC012421]|uniref:hypothetical protein n=1 Tax=Streptomyces sp. NPDC012421 TaxID=3364832 RepID=UPI0036EDF18C
MDGEAVPVAPDGPVHRRRERADSPGPAPPPRKLHLIHRLHITPELRATLAETEQDELPDGSDEISVIERIDYRETSGLTVPPIGPALAAPPQPRAAVTDVALEAVTDHCTGE